MRLNGTREIISTGLIWLQGGWSHHKDSSFYCRLAEKKVGNTIMG